MTAVVTSRARQVRDVVIVRKRDIGVVDPFVGVRDEITALSSLELDSGDPPRHLISDPNRIM